MHVERDEWPDPSCVIASNLSVPEAQLRLLVAIARQCLDSENTKRIFMMQANHRLDSARQPCSRSSILCTVSRYPCIHLYACLDGKLLRMNSNECNLLIRMIPR